MIETSTAYIEKINSNIIYVRVKNEVEIKVEDLAENKRAYLELMGSKQFAFLIELASIGGTDQEAKETLKEDKNRIKGAVAAAFIVKRLPQKLLAKFYQNFYQPDYPTRLFAEKAEAIEWLHTILNSESEKTD